MSRMDPRLVQPGRTRLALAWLRMRSQELILASGVRISNE